MSLDRSLKSASSLVRHRNVLTRDERLLRLTEADKWDASKPVLGIPKVGNRKAAVVKTVKDPATAVAGAAAPAAAGKAAPAAKGAAPAAKGAAPAAKGGAPAAKGAAPAAKAAAPAAKKK